MAQYDNTISPSEVVSLKRHLFTFVNRIHGDDHTESLNPRKKNYFRKISQNLAIKYKSFDKKALQCARGFPTMQNYYRRCGKCDRIANNSHNSC